MIDFLKRVFCKHKVTSKASCPVTERTYEMCHDCGGTVSVMKTHA